jgi:dolichol-phosphate mannosyltransferase
MKTVVVIPTYNESENIERLIKHLFLLGLPEFSVVIVDDNSPDGTAEIVRTLINTYPITLIEREGKLGIGSAYVTGFQQALIQGADIIIEMDADFSHDPDDIPHLLQGLAYADVAIGSRKIPGGKIIGWGYVRKTMSAGAMYLSRTVLHLRTKDVTSGFRAFKRSALEAIDINSIRSNGYAFQEEVIYRLETNNIRIKEIPVTFIDRQEGKSKLGKKDIFEFFSVIIRLTLKG